MGTENQTVDCIRPGLRKSILGHPVSRYLSVHLIGVDKPEVIVLVREDGPPVQADYEGCQRNNQDKPHRERQYSCS
jgi:hypothetical protein